MLLALALSLALDGRIEGTVVTAAGTPVARARVIVGELGHATLFFNTPEEMFVGTPGLTGDEPRRFSALLAADELGKFAVDGLAAGEYSLIASGPESGIAFATLRLDAERPQTLRIVLEPPAFVSGSVKGLAFDPQVNVLELKAAALAANISWIPRLSLEPNSWSFRSAALPAVRDWNLVGTRVVLEQDFRATLFTLPVVAEAGKESRVQLALDEGSSVSGRVLDASGAAVKNVSVVAASQGGPRRELGALTDAEGRYRIHGLSAGTWRLEALRYGVRELPGCGNGPQELAGTGTVTVSATVPAELDLRVNASRPPPKVGELAPGFTATTLDGKTLQLADLRGKVVLLDFWATWCGMCRADFPRLVATYGACSPRLEIVGISIDRDPDLVRRFVASRSMRWPQTALGEITTNPVAQLYNVNSTPSTVLIDADGKVVALNLTGEELRARIEKLLKAP